MATLVCPNTVAAAMGFQWSEPARKTYGKELRGIGGGELVRPVDARRGRSAGPGRVGFGVVGGGFVGGGWAGFPEPAGLMLAGLLLMKITRAYGRQGRPR